jgi:hypothetical protein
MKYSKSKPVVHYKGEASFFYHSEDSNVLVAKLAFVTDHPKLGSCYNVRTSAVMDVRNDGTIETRNTIYKPVPADPR